MFYILFKKVIQKVNEYDKCSQNPFGKDCYTFKKEIKFRDKGYGKPAKTYVWVDKDE